MACAQIRLPFHSVLLWPYPLCSFSLCFSEGEGDPHRHRQPMSPYVVRNRFSVTRTPLHRDRSRRLEGLAFSPQLRSSRIWESLFNVKTQCFFVSYAQFLNKGRKSNMNAVFTACLYGSMDIRWEYNHHYYHNNQLKSCI
ncbi:unnamed protein product [Ixodes persulcatus]